MTDQIVTLGEIMLRLKSPGNERLLQSPTFEATFGGSEANVAVSLAILGLDAAFVCALPDNSIADACVRFLRGYGVDTTSIIRSGERMGIYYLEEGANQRSSTVVYDRTHSAMATTEAAGYDWDVIFAGAGWLHVTGITPALSESAAGVTLAAAQAANARGITVSCDVNFRRKLWAYGQSPPAVMTELVRHSHILIANREDCRLALGMTFESAASDPAGRADQPDTDTADERALSEQVMAAFPNLRYHAMTLRRSYSANHNSWAACLYDGHTFHLSHRYDITDIVDRVGSGDAFTAGLIYGLHTGRSDGEALDFAAAASCLKHSIPGDVNLSTLQEIDSLVAGEATGRVRR